MIVGLDQQTAIFVYCSTDPCYSIIREGDLDPERSVNTVAPPIFHYFRRVVQVIVRRPQLIQNSSQKETEIISFSRSEMQRRRSKRNLGSALVDVQTDSEDRERNPVA